MQTSAQGVKSDYLIQVSLQEHVLDLFWHLIVLVRDQHPCLAHTMEYL